MNNQSHISYHLCCLIVVFLVYAMPAPAAEGGHLTGLQPAAHVPGQPSWTYELFIPSLWQQPPPKELVLPDDPLYPLLVVQNPSGRTRADVQRFMPWAERNGVVVVGINVVRNGYPDHDKVPIQDAVLKTLIERNLAIHPRLRFTIGMSGGSADGARFARRRPQDFAGLVMVGSAQTPQDRQRHLALAVLHGAKDEWTVDGIYEQLVPAAERLGNNLLLRIDRDRGHEWAPQEELEEALDFVLWASRLNPQLFDAEELRAHQQEAVAELQRRRGDSQALTAAWHWPLLAMPEKEALTIAEVASEWLQQQVTLAGSQPSSGAAAALLDGLAELPLQGLPPNIQGQLTAHAEALAKDEAGNRERQRWAQLRALYRAECRAGIDATALAVVAGQLAEIASGDDGPAAQAQLELERLRIALQRLPKGKKP